MIDLHCHILPGIDDGPSTLEESLELAAGLATDGTRTVAATPHLRSDHPDVVVDELADRCRALQEAVAARGIGLDIVPGAEVDVLWAVDATESELRQACYAQRGRDLLLETPYGPLPPGFNEIVGDLTQGGFRVLLAHPERNGRFQRDPSALEALIERGVLIQLTASSLTGHARRSNSARTALRLLRSGAAHVIASDLHGAAAPGRSTLSAGVAAAADVAGARAGWMVEAAPAAILAAEPLPPAPETRRPRSLWRRRGAG